MSTDKQRFKEQIRKELPFLTEGQVDIVTAYVLNATAKTSRGVEIAARKRINEEVTRMMERHVGRTDAHTLLEVREYFESMGDVEAPTDMIGGVVQSVEAIMIYAEHLRQSSTKH